MPARLPGPEAGGERAAIVALGGAHGVHLGALVAYRILARTLPPASGLVIGGAGYLRLAALSSMSATLDAPTLSIEMRGSLSA